MKVSSLPLRSAFLPKSILALRGYTRRKFSQDLVAGLTVGLVALPLAMAFAISSGVAPQSGLYCAVVAGFLISALGGSTTQIGGPTGAFVVVVSGIVTQYGIDGLFMCTMMAGVILALLGLTGLGTAVKYTPRPVVIGFTNGIAVLIASTQFKDFFGLQIDKVPDKFWPRIELIAQRFSTFTPAATAMSLAVLGLLILFARRWPRIPGSIVALLGGTALAWAMHLPLETIQSRFGGIPQGLPKIVIPAFRFDLIEPLLLPAITVAMLGAIESLLSAVVADRMSGDKHNPNIELFAQGIANLASPLVGGLPATGAIARTATNIRSGAQTPISGMIHALTLLAILVFAAPLAQHIPLCLLASILMMVAWNMGEWEEIPCILKLGKADVSVWLITFGLTVFADLSVAVAAGMMLAGLLYIRRVTTTTTVSEVTPEYIRQGIPHSLQSNPMPAGVAIFRIHGPFLFGATDKISVIEEQIPRLPRVVALRLRNMNAIDGTGLHALEHLAARLKAAGKTLLLCGIRDQPARLMARADFHRHIGDANILPTLEAAVTRARALLAAHHRK